MIDKNNFGVIMAGGIGSRFWPMSRSGNPKQFHDILGIGRTLIQMTFDRLIRIIPEDQIFVVTNARYKALVLEQLPTLKAEQVLCEPFMRNTAPCIAYANFCIQNINPNARIIVAPADHLILKEDAFLSCVQLALDETSSTNNLVTLGIKPSRPDTGYGYIQFEETGADANIKKVRTFTEKPDLELAQSFIDSGDFYWNSGIFIWSLRNIQASFEEHLNDMYKLFAGHASDFGSEREQETVEKIYAECDNISIDYGIMEKAKNVKVVLSDFGWSDLGTWGSLYSHLKQDDQGNGTVGNVRAYQSANNVIYSPNSRLVVVQGLSDCIVVDTDDVLLICKKVDEQKIKSIVNDLKIDKGENWV
ncbi:MAG: NTP transferase domain-containing protein [Cryomorphaceae bacterium]|nr:NTP transferase domain-containing protein [Cryomorphaceae bacterium]